MPEIKLEIRANATPDKVFEALTQEDHIKGWWTTDCTAEPKVGTKARFNFKKADFYNVMEITKIEPNLIGWKCVDAGNGNYKEWIGTEVLWEIIDNKDGTSILKMTHKGWEETKLYKDCTDGWNFYAGESLKEYLETGKGKPFSDN